MSSIAHNPSDASIQEIRRESFGNNWIIDGSWIDRSHSMAILSNSPRGLVSTRLVCTNLVDSLGAKTYFCLVNKIVNNKLHLDQAGGHAGPHPLKIPVGPSSPFLSWVVILFLLCFPLIIHLAQSSLLRLVSANSAIEDRITLWCESRCLF
jgi:hypothetical protein